MKKLNALVMFGLVMISVNALAKDLGLSTAAVDRQAKKVGAVAARPVVESSEYPDQCQKDANIYHEELKSCCDQLGGNFRKDLTCVIQVRGINEPFGPNDYVSPGQLNTACGLWNSYWRLINCIQNFDPEY